ncbi:3'-5' exonuclease [Lewinella sp. 4G2]|uniref:3'-5' exonuclease n=1 Tax=Lewinella sp. 4G2 TaxID=1803372 RepID=UPI0007B477F3|nr:3'-5' exonuclease [Lewinella sp. 4G2]OAV43338.1 hypothetical protein A3850_001985 [Lewinella sp. 4G2]
MPHLIFDTETTGFPKSWKAPMTDTANWPAIVQLAWQLVDDDFQTLEAGCHIIKCKERISPKAAKVHGITNERCMAEGQPILEVLAEFTKAAKQADRVIAHNLDFDYKVLGASYLRLNKKHPLGGKEKLCTMKSTVDVCQIPGNYGYKWPTLAELYDCLYGEAAMGAHDAGVDVEITRKCLVALRAEGEI